MGELARGGDEQLSRAPAGMASATVPDVRVVVDNTKGGAPDLAAGIARALDDAGFEVEIRDPRPATRYDTGVHVVVEGVAVRVPEDCAAGDLDRVAAAVRDVEAHRSSLRQRVRSVPIHRGESSRVLTWVDIFDRGVR